MPSLVNSSAFSDKTSLYTYYPLFHKVCGANKTEKTDENSSSHHTFYIANDDISKNYLGAIPDYRDLLVQRQWRKQIECDLFHNKNKFKKAITELINSSEFEYGYFSEADEYLEMLMEMYQELPLLDWIYELYRENIENEGFIVKVLRVLSHIPPKKITRECIEIATQSLESKSLEIKENAVRAFENWEYTDAIPILEKTHFNNSFLDDYIHVVIQDLKELKHGVYDQKD
jgi:hypothetical protein